MPSARRSRRHHEFAPGHCGKNTAAAVLFDLGNRAAAPDKGVMNDRWFPDQSTPGPKHHGLGMRHEARRPLRSPETKKAGNAVPIAARTHGSRRASPGRSKAIMLRHPVDHRAWDMVGGPPNLSFYQKVYVARASCESGHARPEWALMLALNSLRTKLAHRSIRKELEINLSNFSSILRELSLRSRI
jgi:hypothetical protein